MSRIFVFARFFVLTFTLALPAFVQAEGQTATDPTSAIPADSAYRNGVEQATFLLVNQYRKANQMPPLKWDNAIAKVARQHSRDMATGEVDFGHDGFGDRVKTLGTILVGLKGAGENVLETDDPDQVAQHAVALWLKSPHHLANIRGDYNYSGLGIWEDRQGTIYFTQIFIKLAPRAEAVDAQAAPQVVSPYGLLAPVNTR
jgi:uncharacterized protein YkwD